MPNHVHGILILGAIPPKNNDPNGRDGIMGHPDDQIEYTTGTRREHTGTRRDRVPTGPAYWSLGYVVNQYKSSVTRLIHRQWLWPFARQSRYHDHIIRNQHEYERIKRYIQTNPERRSTDTFYV